MSRQLTALVQKTIYGSKVAGHIFREVAIKEKYGPPPMTALGEAQQQLAQMVRNTKDLKFLDYTVGEVAYKLTQGFSVYVFFTVGQVIGRRSIVGFENK